MILGLAETIRVYSHNDAQNLQPDYIFYPTPCELFRNFKIGLKQVYAVGV
ncbi:MAG: hypothetical protein QW161_04915 [Candidatus Bathyarchaeia archaeon]